MDRDFNGDGRTDFLWRDSAGTLAIWLMNGGTVIGSAVLGTVTTDWSIVEVGDFNGDGKADLLWRHTTGAVFIWFMNGLSIIGTASLSSPAIDWQIQ